MVLPNFRDDFELLDFWLSRHPSKREWHLFKLFARLFYLYFTIRRVMLSLAFVGVLSLVEAGQVVNKYSETWSVVYGDNFKVVTTGSSLGENGQAHFVLSNADEVIPSESELISEGYLNPLEGDPTTQFVTIPLEKVGLDSTTQITFMEMLEGGRAAISALYMTADYISSACVLDLIDSGDIITTGWGTPNLTATEIGSVDVSFHGSWFDSTAGEGIHQQP